MPMKNRNKERKKVRDREIRFSIQICYGELKVKMKKKVTPLTDGLRD